MYMNFYTKCVINISQKLTEESTQNRDAASILRDQKQVRYIDEDKYRCYLQDMHPKCRDVAAKTEQAPS